MNRADVEILLNNFPGVIIIDEAYINFSKQKTFIQELTEYPNLIVRVHLQGLLFDAPLLLSTYLPAPFPAKQPLQFAGRHH